MCWGSEASGRLGNGATGSVGAPGVVTGGYSWTDISAGTNHTCGVIANGTGYCWGESENGKLGNGTITPDVEDPSLIADGHTWRRVWASGYLTTCGMTTAGAAYCWGEAAGGKLGNGTTTPDQSSPSLVLGGHTFQDVQSGTNAACGLRTDNLLYCWGDNAWESTGTGGTRTSPFIVSGGHSWTSMAVGGSSSCGIRTDGEAMCWGRSDTGALGNGVINPDTSAVPVLVRDALDKCSISTFAAQAPPEVLIWQDVAYGNGIFVAVGETGTNRVMRSTDYGVTWTGHAAAAANEWEGLTYGNGLFVAVADNGTTANQIMTSPDGITWTARTTPTVKGWSDVVYANGRFVAVSSSAAPNVAVSTDGINWTLHNAAEANTWEAVTYGNGLFVAVARTGTNRVMTSPDGQTWTARAAAEPNQWYNVTYGNNLFAAVSIDGTNRIMTSPDGTTWTARTSPSGTAAWHGLIYANGVFIATGTSGADRLMTSTDGITWTLGTVPAANDWYELAYGNGVVVSVSDDGTNQIMRSTCSDTGCTSPTGTAGSIIYNQTSRVVQWCDGTTWQASGPIGPAGPNTGCSSPTGIGGDVMFNMSYRSLQYCDGDTWQMIGKSPCASCGGNPAEKVAFLTTNSFTSNGNLGGVAGAHNRCQLNAQAAGLSGTYKAWIAGSDPSSAPASHFTQAAVPYVLTNGTRVADNWADLTDGTLDTALEIGAWTNYESGGSFAFTNVDAAGAQSSATDHCSDWTSNSGAATVAYGHRGLTNNGWTAYFTDTICGQNRRLYCFEQ